MNQPAPRSPFTETPPTLGEIIQVASVRAAILAAGMSLLFFTASFIYAQYDIGSSLGVMLARSGQVLGATFVLALACFLIASSRVWSDRAFTVAGFMATFVGLAILTVFFVNLADDVQEWFHYTPILIEAENQKHQKTIDDAKQLKATIAQKLEAKRKVRDKFVAAAKTEEEKQEARDLFDDAIKELEADLREQSKQDVTIAEKSLRPDTSRVALFTHFLSSPSEKYAQDSGIGPAMWGSIFLGFITLLFAVPIGVGAALYLEEYRQEGRIARIIQININNLAGVPSVVYGILGGFVFVYIFRRVNAVFPNVDPFNLLGGGLTLGLLTLPMIIVSSQEAIRAVPASLRHGAYALGATKWQAIWTIVLPKALPGILTGTILSLSRALGEAAPLVLFGAQQQIDRNPWLFDKFTALPLQIYQWCSELPVDVPGSAEPVDIWKYNAAVASTVLLVVLLSLNGIAILMRNRAQKVQY